MMCYSLVQGIKYTKLRILNIDINDFKREEKKLFSFIPLGGQITQQFYSAKILIFMPLCIRLIFNFFEPYFLFQMVTKPKMYFIYYILLFITE